jgi:hypothetical protein
MRSHELLYNCIFSGMFGILLNKLIHHPAVAVLTLRLSDADDEVATSMSHF